MKQTFKLGGTLAAALLLGTMLSGTVSAQTLTMGVRAGPDSIDPHWSTLGSQAETLRHVFRYAALRYHEGGEDRRSPRRAIKEDRVQHVPQRPAVFGEWPTVQVLCYFLVRHRSADASCDH